MATCSQATAKDCWLIVALGRHWSLYHSYCVGQDGETIDPCAFTGLSYWLDKYMFGNMERNHRHWFYYFLGNSVKLILILLLFKQQKVTLVENINLPFAGAAPFSCSTYFGLSGLYCQLVLEKSYLFTISRINLLICHQFVRYLAT